VYEYELGSRHLGPQVRVVVPDSEGQLSESDRKVASESAVDLYEAFSFSPHVKIDVVLTRPPVPEGVTILMDYLDQLEKLAQSASNHD